MGASAKRKKEKQKDFAKPKLKVGKTKPKADNFTDTSFRAKALVLSQQFSADGDGPSPAAQFQRHLSLLRHKSDTQRQESLSFLTSALRGLPPDATLPEPVATFLPKLQPLLLDGAPAVRQQLLKLLKCLPPNEVRTHADQLLLYARAAMTHLSADIRLYAMDILDWLVDVAASEAVSAAGAWIKTLRCLMGLLGWQQAATQQAGWSGMQKPASRPGTEVKNLSRFAMALATYLRAGLVCPAKDAQGQQVPLPLWWTAQNGLPQRSNAFQHLDLFGSTQDEDNAMLEDMEDRQRVFAVSFEPAVQAGIDEMKKQGGELGRASAALRRAVAEGMANFERE